jgi:hypothetical protein
MLGFFIFSVWQFLYDLLNQKFDYDYIVSESKKGNDDFIVILAVTLTNPVPLPQPHSQLSPSNMTLEHKSCTKCTHLPYTPLPQ